MNFLFLDRSDKIFWRFFPRNTRKRDNRIALRTSCPYFSGFVTEPSILSLYTSTKWWLIKKERKKNIYYYGSYWNQSEVMSLMNIFFNRITLYENIWGLNYGIWIDYFFKKIPMKDILLNSTRRVFLNIITVLQIKPQWFLCALEK